MFNSYMTGTRTYRLLLSALIIHGYCHRTVFVHLSSHRPLNYFLHAKHFPNALNSFSGPLMRILLKMISLNIELSLCSTRSQVFASACTRMSGTPVCPRSTLI